LNNVANSKVNWKCYQIYFDSLSKRKLLPCFEHYNNEKDKSFYFFENNVIIDIYSKLDKIEADYVGTCSWKFTQKTTMDCKKFAELVEATNCDYDVILFPIQKHLHSNAVLRNKIFYTSIYKLMGLVDAEGVLPFKMLTDKWTCSYNNYWLATKDVYKHYCESVLIPMMKALTDNNKIVQFVKANPLPHGGKKYPLAPFICELLMGYYVNKFNIKHTIITPDTPNELKPDECWCKVLDKALVPEGTEYIKMKRKFAEELQVSGVIQIQ